MLDLIERSHYLPSTGQIFACKTEKNTKKCAKFYEKKEKLKTRHKKEIRGQGIVGCTSEILQALTTVTGNKPVRRINRTQWIWDLRIDFQLTAHNSHGYCARFRFAELRNL